MISDPLTGVSEANTLCGFGSMLLAEPLRHGYGAGTQITKLIPSGVAGQAQHSAVSGIVVEPGGAMSGIVVGSAESVTEAKADGGLTDEVVAVDEVEEPGSRHPVDEVEEPGSRHPVGEVEEPVTMSSEQVAEV